ncbi:MAG: AAA family ATPase [Planctomycetaceae bacterium]
MLLSFSVSNFRSFYEEATLNMVASNKLSEHPEHRVSIGDTGKHVLRSGLIYGANASGKSNLVKAMAFAQRQIRGANNRVINVEHFRFHPDAADKPTSFEFRFLIDGRVFVYGFDLLKNSVMSEWLAILKGEEEVDVFVRDENGKTKVGEARKLFDGDAIGYQTIGTLAKIPGRKNQLFLSRIIDLPIEARGKLLHQAIWWLTECLSVQSPEHRSFDILGRLHSESQFRLFVSKFMGNVGTGIDGLDIEESERNADEFPSAFLASVARRSDKGSAQIIRWTSDADLRIKEDQPEKLVERRLVTKHSVGEGGLYDLPFGDESDGTQQLLHLMPVLYTLNNECKVVVIDELDRSLHPLLCWEFIRFFSESCAGACKQLIVTTHESHLLNQELLRRDEYWFVEKDAKQQSHLVPLSDFSIRNDLLVQKGYLQGRFGAIPVIGPMETLQQLLRCPNSEAS